MNDIKYIFTKIENSHNRLRDAAISCYTCFPFPPEVGAHLQLSAPPRDAGMVRLVNTSEIQEVKKLSDNIYEVKTKSGSIYTVEEKC